MNGTNPYNCSKPGNLFVGYERLLQELVNGFRNGNSFAILGGRRCGKTSLLLEIEKELQTHDLAPFKAMPRFLDIQGLDKVAPDLLFHTIYNLVVREIETKPSTQSESGKEYQVFLQQLDTATPSLEQKYGADWLVILLVDELDAAISALPDDQFFQNLRNLLMVSRFHRHFRLIASGVREMANLISSGSSPLNNLRHKYLGILSGSAARRLISFGFSQGLAAEIELRLFQLTGRHPYLLQGLLEKLWEARAELDGKMVSTVAKEFLREHNDFDRWLHDFSPVEHVVYQRLSEAHDEKLHVRDLRQSLDAALVQKTDEALTVLSYHGLIDDSDLDEPRLAGTMFRDWYQDHRPRINKAIQSSDTKTIRMFYSYSHKDEGMKDALETHLALLKRQNIIASWHGRQISPGENWESQIDKHIEEADIILLLVSSDFLASDYCYNIEMQRALERHDAGETRVIPVIIRPVDWHSAPFARLQALPQYAKPVSTWSIQDEAWTDIVRGIREVVPQLRQTSN